MLNAAWLFIVFLFYLCLALTAIYIVAHILIWFWGLLKEIINPQEKYISKTDST
jgi:hypothetical protein